MTQNLNEIEQWELDQEIPAPLRNDNACKFQKTKAVLLNNDDHDEGKIEVATTNGGGLSFQFTSREEHTTEEIERCDLGHQHRKVILKDYNFERIHISRSESKNLIKWLRMRVR